jgi:hypothetical protein
MPNKSKAGKPKPRSKPKGFKNAGSAWKGVMKMIVKKKHPDAGWPED